MTSKNRKELKSFFVKNAIPTEGNFADLVDSQLNQTDDGVFKVAGDPLSVVAAAGGQLRALRLYSSPPPAAAEWLISLNPENPNQLGTSTKAFGIADGTGKTRLMLDAAGNLTVTGSVSAAGNVSAAANLSYGGLLNKLDVAEQFSATLRAADLRLGHSGRSAKLGRALVDNTTELVVNFGKDWPQTTIASPLVVADGLTVNLPLGSGTWNRLIVNTTSLWGDAGAQYATIGAGGGAGVMLANPHVPWYASEARASIRYGRTGGTAGNTYWDVGVRADGSFSFSAGDNGGAGNLTSITKAGLFGAAGGLHVQGAIAHVDLDGAFYRNTDGQVYLTVDDNLFLRDSGSGANWAIHFDTNAGTINLKGAINSTSANISGFTNTRGLAVNDGTNSGVGRGLWVWNPGDPNHVIYSANPQGLSPAGLTPAPGFHNGSHRMRFRTANGQGFLFENSSELAMMDLASDTGNLWTRGTMRVGGATLQIGDWTLESAGNHLYIKRGAATVARFSIANDRFNVFKDVNGTGPYFYYNMQGTFSAGGNSPPP